jgi:hypothetical protein
LDGEVEDYQLYIVDRQIRLALKTVGTSGSSGNLIFTMTNINTEAPSLATAVISTNAPNVITDEPLGRTHRIANYNTPISIAVDKPQSLGIISNETICMDLIDNSTVPLNFNRYQSGGNWYDNVTISASSLKANSDIFCIFSYGAAPTVNILTNITGRAFSADQFNLSITDVNTNSVIASNISVGTNTIVTTSAILEADHNNSVSIVMAPGSHGQLNRYNFIASCLPSGVQTVTNGAFNISPTFGTEVNCTITISTPTIHSGNSEIVVIPDNNIVGGASLVLVTLKDSSGAIIPSGGDNVKIFIDSNVSMLLSNGVNFIYSPTTANITAIDYNNGTYGANISSNISGSAVLSFSIDSGAKSANTATAYFNPDQPILGNSSLSFVTATDSVSVGTNSTIRVYLADKYNNTVKNASVNVGILSGDTSGRFTPAPPNVSYTADAGDARGGYYQVFYTTDVAGNVTFGFSANGQAAPSDNNDTTLFREGEISFGSNNTNFTVAPHQQQIEKSVTLILNLFDNKSNPLSGYNVSFKVANRTFENGTTIYNDSANTVFITAVTDHGNGTYIATATTSLPQNVTFDFDIAGEGTNLGATYGKTDWAKFNNSGVPPEWSYTTITATPAVTINDYSTITVTLRDKYDSPINGENITVKVLIGDQSKGIFIPNPPTVAQDGTSNGRYIVRFTTSVAENVTFGFATANGTENSSINATTLFTSTGGNESGNYTTITANPAVTNAGNTSLITVHFADNDNNSINGASIIIEVNSTNSANASISPIPAVNIGNGNYVANLTSSVTGDYTVTFKIGSKQSNKSVNVRFNFNKDPDQKYSFITATPQVPVDGNSIIRVYLADHLNNTINNATVDVSILAAPSGVTTTGFVGPYTSIPYTVDPSDPEGRGGYYQTLYNTTIAGNVTFGFNANNLGVNASNNATTLFKEGNISIENAMFRASPNVTLIGTSVTLTLKLIDNKSNPISGESVIFKAINSILENGTVITPIGVIISSVTDHGNGTYTATVTTNSSQNVTFDFDIASTGTDLGSANGKTAWAKFMPEKARLDSSNTTITASPTVNINEYSTITVTLKDGKNNPVNNESVTVKVLSGDSGTFNPVSAVTVENGGGNGRYTVYFTTPITGNVTFGFELSNGDHNYSKNATTNFIINDIGVDNSNTTFDVNPNTLFVNNQTTLTLYLVDETGINGVPGQSIEFFVVSRILENGTVITNNNTIVFLGQTDHGNGTYTINATTTVTQNVTFNFRANGRSNATKADWAKFNSETVNLGHINTTITATPSLTVNNNSTIVVTLVDDYNNPVNNESVTVTILSGNAGNNGTFYPTPPTVTQDGTGNGKYIVRFTTPVAENVTFGFRVGGVSNNSKNATTVFTSGTSSNNTSELILNPPPLSVSVEENYTATAVIKDADGNPVSSKPVTFSVSGGALNTTNCITATDGTCSVAWTSTVTGSFTINAKIDSNHIKNSPAVREFTAGVANETMSVFLLENGPKQAGSLFNMNTTLKDKYGNVIPHQFVYYSVTPAIANAGFGTIGTEADSMLTSTGVAAINYNTFWSDLVGTYTITVRYGDVNGPEVSGSNKTAVFIPAQASLNSYLEVNGVGPVDVATGFYTVRAYALDGVGPNLVPNTNINITVSNGTLSNGPVFGKSIICLTNAQGYCEYTWSSSGEKGLFTITAAFTNGTAISYSPQQREFISGNATHINSDLVIIESGPKVANGTDRYTAVVTLRDNGNIPAAGSVLVSVTGGLLNDRYVSQSYSVDPVTGNVTIYWTSNTSGSFMINASINNQLIYNGVQTREFIPGNVSIPNSNFTITPFSNVIADNVSAYTLTVNIRDAYQNSKPGEQITFNVAEGYLNNGTVAPNTITCITLSNGECSVTWVSDKIGNFSVSASIGGVMIGYLQYRNFIQGDSNPSTSNLTVTPLTPRVADNSSYFTATAYIRDTLEHGVTGELVTFRVLGGWLDNGTDRGLSLTCVTVNGICTVYWRSDTPGNPTIIANITKGQIGTAQRQFIATNATAANSSLEVTPSGPVAVGSGVYTATVTALDIGGVPAPGAIVQFVVGGGILSVGDCETDNAGKCSVTWTSNQSGNFSISATIANTHLGGNGEAIKASPQYRVFSPNIPTSSNSSLVITPGTNMVIASSGNYYTLDITARDIYNNSVPNQAINIHIEYGELNNGTGFTSGDGTCLTNSNGVCLVQWRSNKTGEFLVNATLQGFTSLIYSSNEDRSRRFSYDNVNPINSYFTVTSYNASQPDNIPVCEEKENNISLCNIYYNINAYIEDTSGNKMEGANVTFTIQRNNLPARDAYLNNTLTDGLHGSPPAAYSCIMNAEGRCSANITLKANIAGTYQIYASAGGTYINDISTGNTKAERTFVAAKASNTTSRLHFLPIVDNSIEADNISYYRVTAEILDNHNNPINNTLVMLKVPSGISWLDNSTAVNSSLTCTTAVSGNCSVFWRSIYANDPQNITAQVQSITLEGTRTFITGAPSSNISNITVSSHSAATNETIIVTVTVNDAQGNPIKNVNHNVIIYTSLANSSFAGGTGNHTGTLINVNGTYSAVLSSKNIGNTTLTFTVDGVGDPFNFEWVYFNSSKVCLYDCEENASYIQAQSPVEVGNNSLVTVYLGDTYGNPIDNLSITVYAFDNNTNSSVTLNGAENVTINGGINGKYEANLTAYNKGNVSVSFIVNNINENANDYGIFAVVDFKTGNVTANESLIYVTHEIDNNTIAAADGIDYYTVTVIARDAYGSVAASNITINFEIDRGNLSNVTTNSGSFQTLTCITGPDGTCVVYWMSEEWGLANVSAHINGEIVSGFPIEREFRRLLFDDNLTITDFAPSSKRAHIGDLIRYTVTIENNIDQNTTFRLSNLIPKGFSFVEGSITSSTVNGTVNSTIVGTSEFFAEDLIIYAKSKLTVVYTLRVGAGAKKGTYKSYVESFKSGNSISNRASTEVEITGDPMLDESLIFGTVYIDDNANGMQDKGEMGIPGVRIASAEGYIITTDQFGRYHLLNILGGEWGVGRNFILKVDESSLPQGSTFTTANPLLRRLTPGIPVRFDFGVKLSNDLKTLETLMQGGAQ